VSEPTTTTDEDTAEPTAQTATPELAPAYRWDLDVLRILAILGVVAIHVFGLILSPLNDLVGTPTWHFGMVLDYATRWCVPLFIMISGALVLAPRAHAGGPGRFYRRRVVRLVPALVVWHLVYLLVVRDWMRGEDLDPTVVFMNLVDARIYTALYFLWLILGLYAVAPVLASFLAGGGARRAQVTALAAMGWSIVVAALPNVAALLGYPRPRSDGALTMWLAYVGLFVAGYAWREARTTSWRWVWTGPLAAALLALVVWQAEQQVQAPGEHSWLQALVPPGYTGAAVVAASVLLYLCGIDVLTRFAPRVGIQRVVRTLSEATFGVFLVHLLVIALIQRWWPEFYLDPSPVAKTQLYVAVLVVSFAVSLLARMVPILRRVF
jgi:surface polysaccharide O-acyltransferase-like enzyme